MSGAPPPAAPAGEPVPSLHRSVGPRFYAVALAVLVVDQLTKWWVSSTMQLFETIRVIGDFFRLTYVHNNGAAFGLQLGGRWSFVAVTILVVVFILFYYARTERTMIARWALALILGGALGNLVDRIRLGVVVDFFHLSVRDLSWPIFNVADIGVSVGVALLAIHLFRKDRAEEASTLPSGRAAGADHATAHDAPDGPGGGDARPA